MGSKLARTKTMFFAEINHRIKVEIMFMVEKVGVEWNTEIILLNSKSSLLNINSGVIYKEMLF